MNLLFDIGNTRSKVAAWEGNSKIHEFVFLNIEVSDIRNIIKYTYKIDKVIVSSVANPDMKVLNFLENHFDNLLILNGNTPTPLKNYYESKNTLGPDRIAAVVGANYLYPNQNLLVIDSGTAITFDLVSSEGEHLGGNISPGIDMRFQALHNFTGKLPLVRKATQWDFIGYDTEKAIIAGVQNGIVFEINGYEAYASQNFENFIIILTGGNIEYFVKQIKNPIFVCPDLVFIGLNRILNYNVKD